MYPLSGRAMREPRQPVKEKGVTVYSTETPTPVAATKPAPLQEAMASAALDGDTQSFDEPFKEEPMKKETPGLPIGVQGTMVEAVINTLSPGGTFNDRTLWDKFDEEERQRWIAAYGGEEEAIQKIRHAISNLRAAGRAHVHNIGYGKWVKEPVNVKAYVSTKPETQATWEPEGDLGDYRHIGTDLDGDPLYYDGLSKRVGTLVFTPLEVT